MSQSMQIDPVADLLNGLSVFRAATLRQLAELGEADEQQRQERSTVPFVIAEDVQMIEHVLV